MVLRKFLSKAILPNFGRNLTRCVGIELGSTDELSLVPSSDYRFQEEKRLGGAFSRTATCKATGNEICMCRKSLS